MSEVLWETLLSLAAAFFFGAVLGCSLKRRFWYGRKAALSAAAVAPAAAVRPDASQPKVEVAARPAQVGDRFERSLSVTPRETAAAVPVARPPQTTAAPLKVEEGGAGPSDDLTRIRGIDPILQRRLKDLGIRRFQDLVRLTPADIKGLNETLDLKGRIDEENWTGQAQILATGGETYYSRRRDRGVPMPDAASPAAPVPAAEAAKPAQAAPAPAQAQVVPPAPAPAQAVPPTPAPAPRPIAPAPAAPVVAAAAPAPAPAAVVAPSSAVSDFSHLRSVRSEALVDSARGGVRNGGGIDDLKRIRGIGVLIEKKLNSLGITQYEQVANWTGADIERISRILDFKGRIEREHWIEQARILATGGQTEFSRR
jgi:predicted flap endonuclease-1-like 5' DNA nuclease